MEAFLKEFKHLKIQLDEIKSATCNFDNTNVIGQGGFGKVYQGVLSHSKGKSMVAFKRLDRRYGQGDPEFLKEILMLSRYTHENLISLLGFCEEDGEKILVYEYASHGSLYHHLSTTTLTWRQRLQICLGAAKGVCYLHDPKETQQRVLHRDIKSSNILLDENWIAKVSDMGLSKIGPANQQYSFLATNVVGTFGYIDPMYVEKSILTKESDVYSFGVVLFEVLCGRQCYENHNGHFQSLVRSWKQRYKQKKLDEIILQDLKRHMDPNSLETYSEVAYQCLHKFCEERPTMSHVVEKLEIAHRFQKISEDYEEMSKTAVPPLVYTSIEELKILLTAGILVNGGKRGVWLNKNGEHCEMISAEECLIPIRIASPKFRKHGGMNSRCPVDCHTPLYWEFQTHARTQYLSSHITYAVNIVFNFGSKKEDYMGFCYILDGETKSSTSYRVHDREDGWLMAELCHFTSDSKNFDLEITFECQNPLAVKGIEFQPLERSNGNTSGNVPFPETVPRLVNEDSEAVYQTVNVIFNDPGVQELVAKLYHKEWSEGQVTEDLVATFADYFTDVKIEERSFWRFVESCLEQTVIVYVDHLLAQKNYIKAETIERMRLDEEVLMDFFSIYISVNKVENILRILIDLRELASAESADTLTRVYRNILEHQPDCPPDVVDKIVGLREGIPMKDAKEVVQECKEIYENSLIDGNSPRTGFVFSKLKSLTKSGIGPIQEAVYQTVDVIFDDPGVQELVVKLYHKEWSEGHVTEYLVATFADYFTDVKMNIEEISFLRFVESCLEQTIIVYVDHLLAKKNYINEDTIKRMRLDEEVLMDFFRKYISVNKVENRLRILIDLRELALAETPHTLTLVYKNILEHHPDCPPNVVERIVRLHKGIPRKDVMEVVQECKEIYENSLINGNPPRTGFVFSKLKSLTKSGICSIF